MDGLSSENLHLDPFFRGTPMEVLGTPMGNLHGCHELPIRRWRQSAAWFTSEAIMPTVENAGGVLVEISGRVQIFHGDIYICIANDM